MIEITTGSSLTVQSALHFLYGQRPLIDEGNAASILETAEFLMIDELKAYCILKMKSMQVTKENCLHLMSVASRFSFKLEAVSEFYRSCLPELLLMKDMLTIDIDSFCNTLTDMTLSYVGEKNYLIFLLKWINYSPERISDLDKILSCLNLDETTFEEVKLVCLESVECVSSLNDCEIEIKRISTKHLNKLQNVFVLYPPDESFEYDIFYVYNLDSNCWYQIPVERKRHLNVTNAAAIRDTGTIIALTPSGKEICFLNLTAKQNRTKRIQLGESIKEKVSLQLNNMQVADKDIYGVSTFAVGIRKKIENKPSSPRRIKSSPKKTKTVSYEKDRAQLFERSIINTSPVSTLYVKEGEDNDSITMKPILSVMSEIKSFCISDNFICLLVPEKKNLLVYSLTVQTISRIDLSKYNLYQASCVSASVNNRVYIETDCKLIQVDLDIKEANINAKLYELSIQDTLSSNFRFALYKFAFDKIIHIHTLYTGQTEAQYQTIPETINNLQNGKTVEIEIPPKLKWNQMSQFLLTKLPKNSLQCHIDCPHCKV